MAFKPGDRVRVVCHREGGFPSFRRPVGAEFVVNNNGDVHACGQTLDVNEGVNVFELVKDDEPEIPAAPVKDIGLEFLKGSLPRVAAMVAVGSDEFERGYHNALEELAAAYGKRIQHVNRMELVDVE